LTEASEMVKDCVVLCSERDASEFLAGDAAVIVIVERAMELAQVATDRVLLKPVHPGHLRALMSAEERSEPPGQGGGLNLRVLLVDDSPINRKMGRMLLQDQGHTVHTVGDGDAAVAEATGPGYDMIFMDLHMPKMDGLEAARRIRSAGCATPIVALTGNALSQDREKCLAAGMDAHLAKPIDERRLALVVGSLFPQNLNSEKNS